MEITENVIILRTCNQTHQIFRLTNAHAGMLLINTHPVKKSDLGFHGNLFGGKLMAWIDAAAASYAMEVCHNRRMVTVCIDKCVFKKSAKEGSLLKIYGDILHIGTTSVTIYLEGRSFNVYTHGEDVILSTNITFVRIDEEGSAIPISDTVRENLKKYLDAKSI